MASRKQFCPSCKQEVTAVPQPKKAGEVVARRKYAIHWADSTKTKRCKNSDKEI